MKNKIEKIVKNLWVQLFFMLLSIFSIFSAYGNAIINYLTINSSWIVAATATFFLCGTLLAGIHAYLRAEKNRKHMIILNARLDGQFKKIDSQFTAVAEALEAHQKAITHLLDSMGKTEDDFNKRFEWLYKQIKDE